jgi:DNA-binding NarL/FixJ family response regulator
MRVLLADDHRETISALRLLLADESGLEVVGEAADAGELLRQAAALGPDLVLVDCELPGGSLPYSGQSGLARFLFSLRRSLPNVLVLALSGRPESRQAALAAVADGFASKADPPEQLVSLLRSFALPVSLP